MAMMNALIGKETPAWVGVQSLPVVQSNVLESYKTVFKKDPPAELSDACNKAKPSCNARMIAFHPGSVFHRTPCGDARRESAAHRSWPERK